MQTVASEHIKIITTLKMINILNEILQKLKREIRILSKMTYDENDEPHDEGILGQITGIEIAINIIEEVNASSPLKEQAKNNSQSKITKKTKKK